MNKYGITFLVAGLVVGVLLVIQFNSDVLNTGRFISDEIQAREDLLKEYLDEQSYLKSRIVTLREQLEEAQSSLDITTESVNYDTLTNLKRIVGLTEVSGAGIEINLNDGVLAYSEGANVSDEYLVQAGDLRDIVNLLFAASAEAISINGQRIIATSPISSVGSTILVNNSHVAPPFTISAVGDPDLMLQRLLNKQLLASLYNRAESGSVNLEMSTRNLVSIPVYNADLKANFITLVNQ